MSVKARKLIRETLKAYQEEDGATEKGSHRDLVTDLLHIASMKKAYKGRDIHCDILDEAWDMYQEERKTKEQDRITKIPVENLSLHLHDEFEFEESRSYLEERIKEARSA